jgi:DNA (cytosine-5)-methyltransferase 1
MKKPIQIADLFCGAGGESTGIVDACQAAGRPVELLAVNHWDIAIETHSRNHPDAHHLCETLQAVDPLRAVPGRRLNLLWASPECTHHSNARGGRPCSDQSRASAWLLLKWLQELYVEHVIIENVPEWLNWGPLDARGNPLASGRGKTFQAFVQAMRSLGYRVDWRILNAADYGAPTTRRRLFVQARRIAGAIRWPEPSHAEHSLSDALIPDSRRPWVPAREIIDWSVIGQSIRERSRPLAPATLRRIETGIRRYWGEWAEPFLVILRGTSNTRAVNQPLPTITAGGGHIGLVTPFVTQSEHGNRVHDIAQPMPTITCSSRGFGLVEPLILHQMTPGRTRTVAEPLPTITTRSAHGLVEPFIVQYYGQGDARSVRAPLDTVTCTDRFGLVEGDAQLDIRFRMLQPHELAAAQGFPSGYWFAGNRSDQVRQIGNAVPCPVAAALCREVVA